MLDFIGKLIILFGRICAIFVIFCFVYLLIAAYVFNKTNKLDDEIDELEENEIEVLEDAE